MKRLGLFAVAFVCCLPMYGATNGCSVSGADTSGSIQSYAYCQPGVIDGRNKGGWIALRRAGDQSNGEVQCYDPEQVVIQDGFLTEILKTASQTCHYWPNQTGTSSLAGKFISAFVQWNTYSFTYGDIIIRMKSGGQLTPGAWPALWLLGANCEAASKVTADNGTFGGQTCNWDNIGSEEIDIFEENAAITSTKSSCNLLTASGNSNNLYTVADPSLGFHTYEVRWTVGSLQWYYDGVLQTGCSTTSLVPSTPMFLQMNIAVESFATSIPTSAMQIDWVKVCQPSPCSGNGGNIVFYDDFVTPIAASSLRPLSKAARLAGGVLPPALVPSPGGMFAHLETPKKEEHVSE